MESDGACRTLPDFITAMDTLVAQTTNPHTCIDFVQQHLVTLLHTPDCLTPDHIIPATESYARHLVYRHPHDRYVIVAMVWQPGQYTPIHDHGGIWCVEGVYQGQMDITQYDVTPLDAHRATARPVRSIAAGLGNVGALIPPHEYHVMANTSAETTITLHVYGGELTHCHVFVDAGDGTYRVEERVLHYTPTASKPVC